MFYRPLKTGAVQPIIKYANLLSITASICYSTAQMQCRNRSRLATRDSSTRQ